MSLLGKHVKRSLRSHIKRQWKIRSLLIPKHTRERADEFLYEREENLIFILGSGRSGTQLITTLLSANNDALVYHEPNFHEDVGTMLEMRVSAEKSTQYWQSFRKIEVYKRWASHQSSRIYGEVNGTIRYQVPGIIKTFPRAKLFLLSRDGRGVVRSVMGWKQFYGKKSKGAYAIRPLGGDPYFEVWDDLTRFEKICWSWMDTNEYLLRYIPGEKVLRLEELVNDYNYAKLMLDDVGINLTQEKWGSIVSKPSKNATQAYEFPEWSEWKNEEKEAFKTICGETMRKLGYSFE